MAEQEPTGQHFWTETELQILLVLPMGQQMQLVWHLQKKPAATQVSAGSLWKAFLGDQTLIYEPLLPTNAKHKKVKQFNIRNTNQVSASILHMQKK